MKRNQAFIVTYFSKTREKFCDHLLGEGEKKRDERKELLIKVPQFVDWGFTGTFGVGIPVHVLELPNL